MTEYMSREPILALHLFLFEQNLDKNNDGTTTFKIPILTLSFGNNINNNNLVMD